MYFEKRRLIGQESTDHTAVCVMVLTQLQIADTRRCSGHCFPNPLSYRQRDNYWRRICVALMIKVHCRRTNKKEWTDCSNGVHIFSLIILCDYLYVIGTKVHSFQKQILLQNYFVRYTLDLHPGIFKI